MNKDQIIKFLLAILLAGAVGGGLGGLTLGLIVLALIHDFLVSLMFSVLIFPFFLWSIFKNLKKRKWFVVLRRLIQAYFTACFLTAMFLLEEGSIEFDQKDQLILYICAGLGAILFTIFMVLAVYFPSNRLLVEIEHIIKGMQIVGLLSESPEKEEK
ncbi:MAG: hypothetical protein R2747_07470 [Pyrinomonadaceae bacterium]